MNPVDSLENQLKHFGLIMAGMFSLIGAVFFFKNWIIAAGTLGVLILFFAGIQSLIIGFLAIYIGIIHKETKKRPLYIINNTAGLDENNS